MHKKVLSLYYLIKSAQKHSLRNGLNSSIYSSFSAKIWHLPKMETIKGLNCFWTIGQPSRVKETNESFSILIYKGQEFASPLPLNYSLLFVKL